MSENCHYFHIVGIFSKRKSELYNISFFCSWIKSVSENSHAARFSMAKKKSLRLTANNASKSKHNKHQAIKKNRFQFQYNMQTWKLDFLFYFSRHVLTFHPNNPIIFIVKITTPLSFVNIKPELLSLNRIYIKLGYWISAANFAAIYL